MPSGDEVLWNVGNKAPQTRPWLSRAAMTLASLCAGTLLLTGDEGRPVGLAVVVTTVIGSGAGATYWLRERRSLVHVRVAAGDAPVLRLQRVSGKVLEHPATEVGRVRMVAVPFDSRPEGIGSTPGRGSVHLRLSVGRKRYHARPLFLDKPEYEELRAAWSRVCPTARVVATTRTWPLPSGEYD